LPTKTVELLRPAEHTFAVQRGEIAMQNSSFRALAGLVTLTLCTPVLAQEALEEVIVTAQKREQSLQEVGISVTAYSGEQMQEFGITNSVDLTSMTPGLQYTVPNAEGSQINFFLRGVGLNDFADANENPVAAYVDEVYRGAMGGLHFQLFDTERAEVLRGPQGTLYGRNTTGGLVHFISRKPTDAFEAYGDVTIGSFGTLQFDGAVSGPIPEIDGLKARVSLAKDIHNGYVKNEAGPDYNSTDAFAARVQLQYDPSETFSALVNFHGSWNHGDVGAWQHQSTKPGPDGNVELPADENFWGTCPGCDVFGYRDNDNNPWHGEFDREGDVVVDSWGLSGKLEWRFDNFDVVSITAFEKVSRLQEEDTDATPFPLLIPTFGADTDQITQELRISGDTDRMRWLGGFYYFTNEVDANYLLDLTNLGFVYFDANYLQETDSWSVFGNVEYDLTDQFTLTGGIRYTEEDKDLDYTNVDLTGLYAFLTAIGVVPLTPFRPNPDDAFVFNSDTVGDLSRHDKSSVSGKIELDWKPTEDWLVYASFSRGTKSAGFNTGFLDGTFIFASNTPQTIPFDDETLHAYEAGFKSTLFNGTTRFNASGFYYDYTDFQTFRFELLNQIIFNTDAEVYGAEFELITSPWEGWDFIFGVALLDATAEDIPNPATGELRDRTMVSAPDVTFNGMARYSWPMWGGTMAAVATVQYQDATYFDIQNHPISRENGFIVGNMRLQWTSPSERWYAAAFVNNIADEEYLTYTFDFTGFGFNQQAYGKPRWIGGTVGYSWE
jgi:iron complex outermembrane receptor protein